jgi:hypothetical protein
VTQQLAALPGLVGQVRTMKAILILWRSSIRAIKLFTRLLVLSLK